MSSHDERSMIDFLSLVEVGVIRRGRDGERIEIRRPGSVLFDDRSDLALSLSARVAVEHGLVVVGHATADGTWVMTGRGRRELDRLRAGQQLPREVAPALAPSGTVTFCPFAEGPSWLLDITHLTADDLSRRLSAAQRAELRHALALIVERLARTS